MNTDRLDYYRSQILGVPAADGWIEWNGGECPVDSDAGVEVKFRNGAINKKYLAFVWRWDHGQGAGDIIAYRVVQEGGS